MLLFSGFWGWWWQGRVPGGSVFMCLLVETRGYPSYLCISPVTRSHHLVFWESVPHLVRGLQIRQGWLASKTPPLPTRAVGSQGCSPYPAFHMPTCRFVPQVFYHLTVSVTEGLYHWHFSCRFKLLFTVNTYCEFVNNYLLFMKCF